MLELDALLDLAGLHAFHVLIEHRERQLAPSFFFLDEKDEGTVIVCPWENETQKQLMLADVRSRMRKARAIRYSFVSECWLYKAPEGMPEAEVRKIIPSKHPDRQEGIIALATNGKFTEWREWYIKRDWKGQVRELPEKPTGEQDHFSGQIAELLG